MAQGAFLSDIGTLRQRPTSRRLLEEILAKEVEHADDLASLLEGLAH